MPNVAEKPCERACRARDEDQDTGECTRVRPVVIDRKPRTFIELRSRRAIIATIGMVRIRSVAGTASGRISVMRR